LIKLAKIVRIDLNCVDLKLEKKVQCFDCKSRCSDGFLSFLFSKKNQGILKVAVNNKNDTNSHLIDRNDLFKKHHQRNDVSGLKFNETEIFRMAFILYGVPILNIVAMLIIGYFTFQKLQLNSDFGGVVGLLIGLFLSKTIIRQIHMKLKPKVEFFK